MLDSPVYERARHIALYAATDGEPELRPLFERARDDGKALLLPRCESDHRLTFRAVESWSELVPGRFGLLEPDAQARSIEPGGVDLALIPAVAVDARGGRLGRGGGWYDRTLAAWPLGQPTLVAVVHAFQVVDRVPREVHDRLVDGHVSEYGLRWTVPR